MTNSSKDILKAMTQTGAIFVIMVAIVITICSAPQTVFYISISLIVLAGLSNMASEIYQDRIGSIKSKRKLKG